MTTTTKKAASALVEVQGDLLTPEQFCVMAQISYDTLAAYRRKGRGPREVRIGNAVRILRADGRFARLRVALSLLRGRMDSTPMAVLDEVSSVELAFPGRARIDVALDGEILPLSTPLRFRCRAKALRVLVPPAADPE